MMMLGTSYRARLAVRWFLTIIFFLYSIAKIFGAQFIRSGFILERPVGEISGIELTWHYFGYSFLMTGFVAGGQAIAAILLAFDRTARLGSLVLLPIIANIVVVNFGYEIGNDTKILSLFLLALDLYLILGDWSAMKRLFWDETANDSGRFAKSSTIWTLWIPLSFLLLLATTLFLLIYTMTKPTKDHNPLEGDWTLESAIVDGKITEDSRLGGGWRKICFESTRDFGVRTSKGIFIGEVTPGNSLDQFTLSYDPELLPPRPGLGPVLNEDDARRWNHRSFADFHWPIFVTCSWKKLGNKVIIQGKQDNHSFEWILIPWKRPRF